MPATPGSIATSRSRSSRTSSPAIPNASGFERETKVLASLNHPHIAQVYGLEPPAPGSTQAIAMELVDGLTLQELLDSEPSGDAPGLPLERALAIARQIATALDAAHEQGIVHRDLKPAKVKVREDGTVKVLDFGLARAFAADAESAQSAVAHSPTFTARSTALGMILGTAAYMSPEQAKGRIVDRRADVSKGLASSAVARRTSTSPTTATSSTPAAPASPRCGPWPGSIAAEARC